jgi:RNA recognition motif-containing protein
LLGDP